MHRTVDVLIYPDVNLLDIAGPVQAFHEASLAGAPQYRTRYLSLDGKSVVTSCGLEINAHASFGRTRGSTDLMVPGGIGVDRALHAGKYIAPIKQWVTKHPLGRVISICSGALLVAQTGLLDGHRATTHWARRDEVIHRFPNIVWKIDQIFVRDGNFYSSAGVTAGIDLALSIIRQDLGPKIALKVAQDLVVYMHRPGGQSQFAGLLDAQFLVPNSLSQLVHRIETKPKNDWTLDLMADEAGMTSRTLSRRFAASLQISPLKFVERVRVSHASNLLISGLNPNKAAVECGFGDLQRMQRAFGRQFGMTVNSYMARFSASDPRT